MLIFTVVMAISFYGYGRLCALASGVPSLDTVMLSVLGIDFLIVIGGAMNWASLISPASLTLLLGVGVVAALVPASLLAARDPMGLRCYPQDSRLSRSQRVVQGILGVICFLTIIYWGFAPGFYANPHDDYQAYLVFPYKMLATGSLGLEPFSERRMVTGLGGNSFLQALVLSWLPLNCINLIDPGYATVLLVAIPFFLPQQKLPVLVALLAACAIAAFPAARINTTATVLPTVQLLVLYKTLLLSRSGKSLRQYAGLYGMQLAAIATMKSSLIPALGLWAIMIFVSGAMSRSSARPMLREYALVALIFGVAILPWMWVALESNGTALYPILGKGFHRTAYKPYQASLGSMWTSLAYGAVILKNPLFICTLLLFACGLRRDAQPKRQMRISAIFSTEALTLALATFGGIIAMWFAVGGVGLDRYAFSSLLAAFLVLAYESFTARPQLAKPFRRRRWVSLVTLSVLLGSGYSEVLNGAMTWVSRATHNVFEVSRQERELRRQRYRKLFESVPLGERVLARLVDPYLCDFSTHRIYIADWPGMASPPPGMPEGNGGEALAGYLLGNGIRYLAYSYKDEAGFPRDDPEITRRMKPGANLWVATTARLALAFQADVCELMATRQRIADDGAVVILDLARHLK